MHFNVLALFQTASQVSSQIAANTSSGGLSTGQYTFDLGIILALLIQTSLIARWVGDISRTVKDHEKKIDAVEVRGSQTAADALHKTEAHDREIERIRDTLDTHTQMLIDNNTQLSHFQELASDTHQMLKEIHRAAGQSLSERMTQAMTQVFPK